MVPRVNQWADITNTAVGVGISWARVVQRLLNVLFKLNLDNDALRTFAVKLGMDCPFFIENVPALSTGRGEFLKPLSLYLDGLYLVVVKPPVHVSTAAAFIGIKPLSRENSIDEYTETSIELWRHTLHNDFEKNVFELYPDILEIKNSLYRQGAVYASMSGSGSAVYGLFNKKPAIKDYPGCEVFQALLGSQSQ